MKTILAAVTTTALAVTAAPTSALAAPVPPTVKQGRANVERMQTGQVAAHTITCRRAQRRHVWGVACRVVYRRYRDLTGAYRITIDYFESDRGTQPLVLRTTSKRITAVHR